MSLLSRFFRKAQPLPMAPQKPPEKIDSTAPQPSLPDRAALAAKEEEALRAAIDSRDAQAIARLAIEGMSTKIRQLAAEAVDDPVQLRQLLKDARGGNDKSVYKILARKRDALLAQERQREQLLAEISAIATAIERHSQRAYDPLFTATLEQLEHRWKAVVANAEPDSVQSVQQAIDRSREVIAQHLREIAAQASRELAAANAAAEAQRQREEREKAEAAAAAERAQVLEAERKAQAEKHEAEAAALRRIGGLIRKALRALNEGASGRTAGLRRAIEEALPTSPPLPAHLSNQLQQLDAKLNELKDWKSFSVEPKRVELMEEMESLVGSTLEPVALADRIKSLQQQWRTLSKGAGENLEEQWQRFQEAAQKAYQPCREYFEAQAGVRAENLQRRSALVDRLAAFEVEHNWEQPDWRAVMAALRESRQEWRQHSPVDAAAGKALQERFRAVTDSLQSRLAAEYERNVKEKTSIIDYAERLIGSEDSRKAIDMVKQLQQRWKSVGPVPRAEDQQLWEKFRQHCDAVFQKRHQEMTEHVAGLESNKSQVIALCEELETIAALSGPQLLEAMKKLPEIRGAFEAAGDLPRERAREIRGRFDRLIDQCEKAVGRQQVRDAEQVWIDLFDAANRVRGYRLAAARNADAQERDALKQAAESSIAAARKWPKRGIEVLRNALAKEEGTDFSANEAALRTLCIRAEMIADVPTPPEDQPLRREYQMRRLVERMGQGLGADEVSLDALTIEWIGVGPIEDATYLQLVERFRRCRQQLSRG